MSDNTAIEWTHRPGTRGATWNPWYGCTHVSEGCDNCYMFREMRRYTAAILSSSRERLGLPVAAGSPTPAPTDGFREKVREAVTEHRKALARRQHGGVAAGRFFDTVAALCEDGSPTPAPTGSARDWPEDFAHENGKYMNECHQCERQFLGHKRRVLCKVCAGKRRTPAQPERGELPNE